MITKHPGTGGAVTTETVTAQLLYEIDGPRYLNPDVIARFDAVRLDAVGPNRVRVSGARGEPAPATLKVGLIYSGGYRNQTTLVLTGDRIEQKAELAQRALWAAVPGGRGAFDHVKVRLLRADRPEPGAPDEAVALLTTSVAGRDRRAVAGLARAAVETGLASYPGLYLTEPPAAGASFTVFWPTLRPAAEVPQCVRFEGREWTIEPASPAAVEDYGVGLPEAAVLEAGVPTVAAGAPTTRADDPTLRFPLGRLVGSRSGDKGGNATLGVWARDDTAFAWLSNWLTESRWHELLPKAAGLVLRPWALPNLRAMGVTVVGLLGAGVAANLDLDSQGKGLGEFVRARPVDIPESLLTPQSRAGDRPRFSPSGE